MSKSNTYQFVELECDFQKTITDKLSISGRSPYTKEQCKIEISPQDEDSGIIFITPNGVEIASLINNAKSDNDAHTTSLVSENEEIKTVEHLLSAIWGLGVDNAVIKMHTTHLPFLDASAIGYANEIMNTGIRSQSKLRKYIKIINERKFKESPSSERFAILRPSKVTEIKSTTSFDNIVGTKTVDYKWDENKYLEEISFARTFLRSPLDDEGKVWDHVKKLFPFIPVDPENSPIIIYNDNKFITPLRSEDEPARHKVLDFIGDISLLGYRLLSEIELNLPGHRFTRQIVREISKEMSSTTTIKITKGC